MYNANLLTRTRTSRCGILRTRPPHLPRSIWRLHIKCIVHQCHRVVYILVPEAFFQYYLFLVGNLRRQALIELRSRSLRISLSCWLSTWQLSKMSFSFDQSHPQRYLIHPIIWLVEQLKMSSNQNRRSKADGMKVRFPTVATRGFLFSALSASCQ